MHDSQNFLGSSNPLDLKRAQLGSIMHQEAKLNSEHWVSFHAELPSPLQAAMVCFIEKYPNWDQYRLIQAALAGFLVQNGISSRSITRLYIENMFNHNCFVK
tara:strand:+ start:221 stop:526 length:306 start_codon:yes stop_codon:yes gene_type:complete